MEKKKKSNQKEAQQKKNLIFDPENDIEFEDPKPEQQHQHQHQHHHQHHHQHQQQTNSDNFQQAQLQRLEYEKQRNKEIQEELKQMNGETNQGFTLNGKQLSLVGANLTQVPSDLSRTYGSSVEDLDFSFNQLTHITNIEHFVHLKSLVVDNNQLQSDQVFPKLLSLNTLCVNNNKIDDLNLFLGEVSAKFPNITYLSLLKNPACPNYFVGKDHADYQRYRYYVLYRLGKLKFLDSGPVTKEERQEAKRIGHLMIVAKPNPEQYQSILKQPAANEEQFTPLSSALTEPGRGKASFGRRQYVYLGKESEGNRFIVDKEL